MAKVGISNLHYGLFSTEETASANPTIGTIKAPTVGMVTVDIAANSNKVELYADNILWDSENVFTGAEMTVDLAELPLEVQADLLGHTYDSTAKTLIKKSQDVAPYAAIGFEFLMSNGKKLCVWLYKCKASEPNQNSNTRGENTEYGTNEVTFTCAALKGGGDNKGRWQYCQEFDADAATTSFYTSVPLASVSP